MNSKSLESTIITECLGQFFVMLVFRLTAICKISASKMDFVVFFAGGVIDHSIFCLSVFALSSLGSHDNDNNDYDDKNDTDCNNDSDNRSSWKTTCKSKELWVKSQGPKSSIGIYFRPSREKQANKRKQCLYCYGNNRFWPMVHTESSLGIIPKTAITNSSPLPFPFFLQSSPTFSYPFWHEQA